MTASDPTAAASIKALPRFARELLASCPAAGAGVHNWLFRVARVLHRFYADKHELALLIEAASGNCGRHVSEQEIVDAIRNSAPCAWQPGQGGAVGITRTPVWPVYQRDLAENIHEEISLREYPRTWQLFDRKSLAIRSFMACPDQLHAASVLRIVHSRCESTPVDEAEGELSEVLQLMIKDRSDPLICAGVNPAMVGTGHLSEWDVGVKMRVPGQRRASPLFLDDLQFVVPNAMRTEEGVSMKGETSFRCRDNAVLHRRFLIVEFDQKGDEHLQPALHWHLREFAPLVMCVDSGGKSIHGWYYVEPRSEQWQLRFFRYAVSLGADAKMWWPEQFSRMPNGKRRDEEGQVIAFQPVIYFDPMCLVAAGERQEVCHGEVC